MRARISIYNVCLRRSNNTNTNATRHATTQKEGRLRGDDGSATRFPGGIGVSLRGRRVRGGGDTLQPAFCRDIQTTHNREDDESTE